jgi:hypothetical protein
MYLEKGEYICNPQFEYIHNFHSGIGQVEKNKKYGLINLEGKLLVPCEYDLIYTWRYPIVVQKHDKYGLVDYNGLILNPEYISIGIDEDYPIIGLYKDYTERYYYHLDKKAFVKGYSSIEYEGNGYAEARRLDNGKMEILDRDGEVISDPSVLSAKGVECFQEDGQWGFRKGTVVLIPPQYKEVDGIFINGAMRVRTNGRYGYVNEERRGNRKTCVSECRGVR